MRKSILSSLLMLFMAIGAMAQTLQFTPLAGYTFGDKFPISGGSARLGDGFTYGGIFSYVAERYNTFDLTYTRQGAIATANSAFLFPDREEPIGGIRLPIPPLEHPAMSLSFSLVLQEDLS